MKVKKGLLLEYFNGLKKTSGHDLESKELLVRHVFRDFVQGRVELEREQIFRLFEVSATLDFPGTLEMGSIIPEYKTDVVRTGINGLRYRVGVIRDEIRLLKELLSADSLASVANIRKKDVCSIGHSIENAF